MHPVTNQVNERKPNVFHVILMQLKSLSSKNSLELVITGLNFQWAIYMTIHNKSFEVHRLKTNFLLQVLRASIWFGS